MVTLLDALSGKTGKLATVADLYERKAVLVLGADLALEHPLLSFQIRANYRHHQAHVYVVTPEPVREDKYAARRRCAGADWTESLRDKLKAEPELVILFDDSYQGRRRPQAGGVRRIAGHSGEVHLPGGLFQLARRGGYGADAGTAARLPAVRAAGHARATRCWRRIWTCCGWWARIR